MKKRIRCNSWTPEEMRLVDECLCYGIGPVRAEHLFPGRTHGARHSKFKDRRQELGLVGKRGRPSLTNLVPIRLIPAPVRVRRKPVAHLDTPEAAGCKEMLRRHLQYGAHWINDPAMMARAQSYAGL